MNPEKIILLRALPGLGDMLCITPALVALRSHFPYARITLIGMEWAKDWAVRYKGYLNQFIEFPGFPGMRQGWKSHGVFVQFLEYAIAEQYDVALQVHGSGTISNYFVPLLGAKFISGFYTPTTHCPDPDTFLPWIEEESESGRYLRLLQRTMNISVESQDLIFPMSAEDELEFQLLELPTDKPIACIHPGASSIMRICPLEVFIEVGKSLTEKGYQVVLTGTKNEAIYTSSISKVLKEAIDLTGKTSLGCLGQLIKHSKLVVCNDTGVSHLADALKTKSVVVFMENPPSRWAPRDQDLHRVIDVRGFEINFPTQEVTKEILEEVDSLLGL